MITQPYPGVLNYHPCSYFLMSSWISNFNKNTGRLSMFTSLTRCQQTVENPTPAPSNNIQHEDSLGVMGMTRSTTSSPVPPSFQSTAWMSCRRMIYIKSSPPSGHWPVPESFWPDPSLQALVVIFFWLSSWVLFCTICWLITQICCCVFYQPSRDAHPSVLFSCNNSEPLVLDNLPFDKYELEPSPLTQYILERKSPSTCWQVLTS